MMANEIEEQKIELNPELKQRGSFEFTSLDSYLISEEDYENAKAELERGHDWWVDALVSEVKVNREAQKHLKFAGNKFLECCAHAVLIGMGY